MITCKEDLVNTYIENDFGELRDLYIEAMNIFGVKPCDLGGFEYLKNRRFIGVWGWGWGFGLRADWSCKPFCGGKRLTIKDLKPTKNKLVKAEESIFDLKEKLEGGGLHFRWLGNGEQGSGGVSYDQIDNINMLLFRREDDRTYRQVEIDWRDEVKEVYDAVELPVGEQGSLYMGEDWDEQEFIKFCHLVASLTEKPEGV